MSLVKTLLIIKLPIMLSQVQEPPKPLKNKCNERYTNSAFWHSSLARGAKENILPSVLKNLSFEAGTTLYANGFNMKNLLQKARSAVSGVTGAVSALATQGLESTLAATQYITFSERSSEYAVLERVFKTSFDKENYLKPKIVFQVNSLPGDISMYTGAVVREGEYNQTLKEFDNPLLEFYKTSEAKSMGYSKEEFTEYLRELSDNASICIIDEEFTRTELAGLLKYFKDNDIKKEKIKNISTINKALEDFGNYDMFEDMIDEVLFEKKEKEDVKIVIDEALKKKCLEDIRNYLLNDFPQEKVDQFLQIQANLTYNRLAWNFLKNSNNDTKNYEELIDKLLDEMEHPHKEDIKKFFKLSPLSRGNTYAISQIINQESKVKRDKENSKYFLDASDFKLLEFLYQVEKNDGMNFPGSETDKKLVNFIKIINSTYVGKSALLKTQFLREQNTKKIEMSINILNERIQKSLRSIAKENECFTLLLTGKCYKDIDKNVDIAKLLKFNKDIQSILSSSMDSYYSRFGTKNLDKRVILQQKPK